jgi:hypothetical protein
VFTIAKLALHAPSSLLIAQLIVMLVAGCFRMSRRRGGSRRPPDARRTADLRDRMFGLASSVARPCGGAARDRTRS